MANLIPIVQSLQNVSSPQDGNALDLETTVAKEFTIVVSAQNVTSFSLQIIGDLGLFSSDVVLATVTAAGVYTVNTHWVKRAYAHLTSISGTSPLLTVGIAAGGI